MRPKQLRRLALTELFIEQSTEDTSLSYKISETTYRQDGLSIGRDYLRIDGKTYDSSRGNLSRHNLQVYPNNILGRGAFSSVRLGKWSKPDKGHNSTELLVAVKEYAISKSTRQRREMMVKELRLLCCEDRSVFMIGLYGAFMDKENVVLVMELMDRGSLQCLIQNHALSEDVIASINYQLILGLEHLHAKRRLHRDLKPANILINSSGNVKLCDLGMATLGEQSLNTTVLGTSKFMAPERLRSLPYSRPSDIWSLGLVILQCITQENPWHEASSVVDLLMMVEETNVESLIPSFVSQDLRELVKGCLQVDPAKRIPASILKYSPFFTIDHEINSVEAAVYKLRGHLCNL